MPFKTKCPGCAKGLTVPDAAAGKRVKCPACAHQWVLAVPVASSQAATAPAEPAATAKPATTTTKCPGCWQPIQVPAAMAGKQAKCPACGKFRGFRAAGPSTRRQSLKCRPAATGSTKE